MVTYGRTEFEDNYTGTDDVAYFLPRGKPRPGITPVIYCHGFLGTARDAGLKDKGSSGDDLRMFAQLGHPVAAIDAAGPSTWGINTAWGTIAPTLTKLNTKFGCRTNKVFLLCDSMGALTGLNYGYRFPATIAGIALRSPVVSLGAFRTRNTATFGTAIEDAYGGLANFNAALPTNDPAAAAAVAALKPIGNRIAAWYATSDDLIPPTEVTTWAASIGAKAFPVTGEHADGVNQSLVELGTFFAECVERLDV